MTFLELASGLRLANAILHATSADG